jgi:ribosomal protein L11 methyltransferase
MAWLECSVEVEAEAVESVSELMASYGYNNGVAVDQPVIHGADGPDYRYDTERPVTVRTWIPVDHKSEDARAKLEQALWHLSLLRKVGSLKVTQLEEQLWAEAWKKHYTVQRIGKRSVIVPSWLEYAPQPIDIILKLDPGMAFWTGLHPTTRMCTQLLEEYMPPDTRVMDLGCGSGILAIVAAHLGAKEILVLVHLRGQIPHGAKFTCPLFSQLADAGEGAEIVNVVLHEVCDRQADRPALGVDQAGIRKEIVV